MAKKTKKEIKKLKKAVGELQDQNEELSEKLAESLEEQSERIQTLQSSLQSQQEAAAPADEDQSGPEATEAAERKAEELDVDLSEVEGTGAEGRILVKDVEEAAEDED